MNLTLTQPAAPLVSLQNHLTLNFLTQHKILNFDWALIFLWNKILKKNQLHIKAMSINIRSSISFKCSPKDDDNKDFRLLSRQSLSPI